MLESLLSVFSPIMAVLAFAFGFYQLRRADQARKETERVQRDLADLQAARTEAAELRARRFEIYRAHLAKLDRVNKLASDQAESGELAKSQEEMFAAIFRGDDAMEVMASSMKAAVDFAKGWGIEAERVARETQELRLVASPKMLPLLDNYADATRSFIGAGADYLGGQAQTDALAVALATAMGQEDTAHSPAAAGLAAVYETLQTIRGEIEAQMRADLGADL